MPLARSLLLLPLGFIYISLEGQDPAPKSVEITAEQKAGTPAPKPTGSVSAKADASCESKNCKTAPKEMKMQTTVTRFSRLPLATIAALGAVSMPAQTPLLDQGRAALARGDSDTAISILETAVAQYPKNAGAHFYLANAYGSKAGRGGTFAAARYAPKAKGAWEQAVALNPKHIEARFSLVEKNYSAAFAEFETGLKLDPDYMPLYYHLGRAAALAGANLVRGAEALKKYVAATPRENEPALANAHYRLGMVYEKEGKMAEAKQSYQTSLRLDASLKEASEALQRLP